MSVKEIPLSNDVPAFRFQAQLDGAVYTFRLQYNDRMARWTLGIYDQDGNPIRTGIKLNTSWPLTRQYHDPALPPGDLMMVDTSGGQAVADDSNLGDQIAMLYGGIT